MTGCPTVAMVLAAGLGRRMLPLTENRPKALVPVAGQALIDHVLDRLVEAGVENVAVNLHHRAEDLRRHLAGRAGPAIAFSEENGELLDTGGGVANALETLGDRPFYVANCDVLWGDGLTGTLARLARRWDARRMDALLLVQPAPAALGYQGLGDYFMDPEGALRRRKIGEVAPFVFAGVQILHPRLFVDHPSGPFSLNALYDLAEWRGRLWGLRHEGMWAHVGRPQDIGAAERELARP